MTYPLHKRSLRIKCCIHTFQIVLRLRLELLKHFLSLALHVTSVAVYMEPVYPALTYHFLFRKKETKKLLYSNCATTTASSKSIGMKN